MVLSLLLCGSIRADDAANPSDGAGEIRVEAPRPLTLGAASATVLPIDARLPASADVASVLDLAAGTTVTELGGLGDYAAVSIRGSALRQVELFLDGVPLNPDGGSTVNLAELPLTGLSRIEVYRSAAPPQFAAAPLGGVVNLVTAEQGPGDEPSRVALAAGSWGTLHTSVVGVASTTLGHAPADALLLVDDLYTEGRFLAFDDQNTRYLLTDDHLVWRENNAKSQLSAHLRLRVGPPRLRLTLLDGALWRDEGVPGPLNLPARHAGLTTGRNLAVLQLDATGGDGRGLARVWRHDRAETLDDRAGELGAGGQWQQDALASTGLLLSGSWLVSPHLAPSLTLMGRLDRYQLTDELSGIRDDPRRRRAGLLALGADVWLAQDRVMLSPVLQASGLDNRLLGDVPWAALPIAPADEAVGASVDPRLSARAALVPASPARSLDLRGSIGHFLRPPDLSELFGDRGSAIGNSALRPETGWAGDVGLAGARAGALSGALRIGGDLTWFFRSVTDLITWVQNSQQTMVPVNVGRAFVHGVEVAGELAVPRVDARTALTWTDAQNRSTDPALSGNQLPNIPMWEASEELSLHWEERVRVGYSFSYTDGNWWDATNRFRSAPRALHGAFVRSQPGPRWPEAELSVRNLTNRIAEVVPRDPLVDDGALAVAAVTDFTGYPLPGRTFLFSLTWEL